MEKIVQLYQVVSELGHSLLCKFVDEFSLSLFPLNITLIDSPRKHHIMDLNKEHSHK